MTIQINFPLRISDDLPEIEWSHIKRLVVKMKLDMQSRKSNMRQAIPVSEMETVKNVPGNRRGRGGLKNPRLLRLN
jgi:hypothetical protein